MPTSHVWVEIEKTTPSGKTLYKCSGCGWEVPAPSNGPCGKCPSCGFFIGSIGHAIHCTEDLSAEDQATLEKLRGGIENG